MGKKDFRNRRIAVIGNTRLTLKSIVALIEGGFDVRYVFGLPTDLFENKVNAVSLEGVCSKYNIFLDCSNEWPLFEKECEDRGIDLVLTLGDSRIVPANIVQRYEVVGNHGAPLPDVQGGASLVWGRMLGNGEWGVSIFCLDEKIDSGDIMCVKYFRYDVASDMKHFTETADDVTVCALMSCMNGDFSLKKNSRWKARVAKHIDSQVGVNILKLCLESNTPVYMPPRRHVDGQLCPSWAPEFSQSFKVANNLPYPKWYHKHATAEEI